MRVVIVGGAGFLGTALAERLARRGDDVLVADTYRRIERASDRLQNVDVRVFDYLSGDEAGPFLLGADALVHLACATTPTSSMRSILDDAQSNILPSIRLFEAADSASVRRVVFSSSGGTVYGAPSRSPVRESDIGTPLSAYGASKIAIENYLSLYGRLSPVSLRVANPYGPYQLMGTAVGVIARYVSAAAERRPIEVWGDGSVVRDYIAIDDVADAFELALSPELESGAYNIGTGVGTSINEVIDLIQGFSGYRLVVQRSPARSYDVPEIVLDCEKFSARTGWLPRIALREGVSRLVESAEAGVLK